MTLCPQCLRPLATDALDAHPAGCDCAECRVVCWDGPDTCAHPLTVAEAYERGRADALEQTGSRLRAEVEAHEKDTEAFYKVVGQRDAARADLEKARGELAEANAKLEALNVVLSARIDWLGLGERCGGARESLSSVERRIRALLEKPCPACGTTDRECRVCEGVPSDKPRTP